MNNKKHFALSAAIALTMGCMFSLTAAAEEIYYDGSHPELLRPDPIDGTYSALFAQNSITNNTITVKMQGSDRLLEGIVYGGISTTDQLVSGNSVYVYDSSIAYGVSGGSSLHGSANNNHVTLDNTVVGINDVTGGVYGGLSVDGDTNSNTVTLSNTTVVLDVMGGNSSRGTANSNAVILSATTAKSVTGGRGGNGDADGNTVILSNNSKINGRVIGGDGGAGHANSNTVILSDTIIKTYVIGGEGETGANDNSVVLNNVEGQTAAGGRAFSGNTNNNSVILINGKNLDAVYGGETQQGNADGNIATIRETRNIREIRGGMSYEGNANSNKVTLTDNSMADVVTGGYSFAGGNANNNSVTLGNNTTVTALVIGGSSNEGNATNNTVNVSGTTDLTESEIYGGYSDENTTGRDIFTGNTLNWASKGETLKVANFEYYNFTIPENAQAGNTLLTINDTEKTDLRRSDVKLVGVKAGYAWRAGDSVVLLSNANGIEGADDTVSGKATGILKKYGYEIEKIDGTKLEATITSVDVRDQAKSLSEGRIAAIGFINTAADLASGSGLQNAIDSSSTKYDLFGAMNYSDSRYDSGSHADVKGNSMLLGFSRKIEAKNSNWVVGAFLESGNSSYETFNSFADGDVRANGKNNYFGGGIMARNVQNNGMYVDGSLRFGRMSTDYNSNDIETKYDLKSTYYGLHLGVGKVFKLNNSNDLDVYGKYFWSHQNAATASIEGDSFNFDSINSHRLRIGARLNMLGGGNGLKTYVGLAYEHEFSGSARATYSGENIAAPSIKGATGIGEIGMVYKPSTKSAFSMDVGLNGFIGKRQGIGGGVKLNWGF